MKNMRVAAVPLDIIETVFSLESLRGNLTAAGLPSTTLETWFALTLRDAFALKVTEVYKPFLEVTGFVARGTPFPATMMAPNIIGETLAQVGDALIAMHR